MIGSHGFFRRKERSADVCEVTAAGRVKGRRDRESSRNRTAQYCAGSLVDDAGFMFALMNEPSYLRFIGDKGIKTISDAREYILNSPVDSYERFDYGLYLTELKASGACRSGFVAW